MPFSLIMKKLWSLLVTAVLLTIVITSLSAQEQTVVGKFFYVELYGPGVIVSANFDSRFQSGSRLGFGYRLGLGFGVEKFERKIIEVLNMEDPAPYIYSGTLLFLPNMRSIADIFSGKTRSFFSFPIGLNYIFGQPNRASAFELGAGVTLLTNKVSLYNYEYHKPGHVIGHLNVMYRLMPLNNNFLLRAGFSPIIGTAGDFFPMYAFSVGYAF